MNMQIDRRSIIGGSDIGKIIGIGAQCGTQTVGE
jgi:hypothetical protein